jgi:hypothetical protein
VPRPRRTEIVNDDERLIQRLPERRKRRLGHPLETRQLDKAIDPAADDGDRFTCPFGKYRCPVDSSLYPSRAYVLNHRQRRIERLSEGINRGLRHALEGRQFGKALDATPNDGNRFPSPVRKHGRPVNGGLRPGCRNGD